MPTTLGLCFLANSTASPMWSPCPCVHNMTSILSKVFLLDGVEGLFMTQGSTRICLPPGVSNRKVACPSQVTLIPLNLISSPHKLKILVAGSDNAQTGEAPSNQHSAKSEYFGLRDIVDTVGEIGMTNEDDDLTVGTFDGQGILFANRT